MWADGSSEEPPTSVLPIFGIKRPEDLVPLNKTISETGVVPGSAMLSSQASFPVLLTCRSRALSTVSLFRTQERQKGGRKLWGVVLHIYS